MKNKIQTAFSNIRADNALIDNTTAYLRTEAEKRRQNKQFTGFAGGIAAVVVLGAVGIFALGLYFTADAYISIDVNPSVELKINQFNRVIGAYALNGDGVQLLSEAALWGKTYDEAAGLIMSAINTDGYLAAEDALVSVTVRTKSNDREQILCDTLRRFIVELIRSSQSSAEVEVFPVSAEVWNNAHECKISPAKYLAIQDLMEADQEATVESFGNSSISQIRRRAHECRNNGNIESDAGNSIPDTHRQHRGCQGNTHSHKCGH